VEGGGMASHNKTKKSESRFTILKIKEKRKKCKNTFPKSVCFDRQFKNGV
jgi:hypothetical protein